MSQVEKVPQVDAPERPGGKPSEITTAQAAARRANGAKSQGPVTPEGKATSSANAMRHGIYAPRDAIEERQARTIATLYIKLDRLDRLEAHGIDRDTDHARINELHQHADDADVEAARARSLYEALTGTHDDYDWQGFTSTVLDIANGGIPVAVDGLWTTERIPTDDDEWRAVVYALLDHFYPTFDAAAAAIMNYSLSNAHEVAETEAQCLAIAAHRVLNGTLPKTVPLAARLARQLDQALHAYRALAEREIPVDSPNDDGLTSAVPFRETNPICENTRDFGPTARMAGNHGRGHCCIELGAARSGPSRDAGWLIRPAGNRPEWCGLTVQPVPGQQTSCPICVQRNSAGGTMSALLYRLGRSCARHPFRVRAMSSSLLPVVISPSRRTNGGSR